MLDYIRSLYAYIVLRILEWRAERVIRFARAQGWIILDSQQVNAARALLHLEENRVVRLGGGNASRYRQPRKTLRRIIQRTARILDAMSTAAPRITQ